MTTILGVTGVQEAVANGDMTTSTAQRVKTQLSAPPDITAAKTTVDDLGVRAVSFRGTAHDLFGEPRQDSFAFAASDDWVVLIVSDGIGSCKHSHHGASASVNAIAAAVVSSEIDPDDGDQVLATAADAARDAAQALDVPSKSVSATLTVAAVERTPHPDGSRHAIIHAVGDSPALRLDPETAAWTYLTPIDDGPSNVVRSWVPDRAAEFTSFGVTIPAGSVLVLASDGFTTPLGDGSGPLGTDLAARWAAGPRELLPFLVDLSFNAYHDDKTVVAMWNPPTETAVADPDGADDDQRDADV
jgi:serine/threonine protein phosphatase PrpC